MISHETFTKSFNVPLQKSSTVLYGPGKSALEMCGVFQADIVSNDRSSREEIYVVKGLEKGLLGRPAIESLCVIKRVTEIHALQEEYPNLFKGLGAMKEPCTPLNLRNAKPFGRYHFNRLPFGISSAPEHFQRRMSQILDGVECLMDDVLIHGPTTAIHDERLRAVMKRMEAAGVTLNVDKCELSKPGMKFLGHVICQWNPCRTRKGQSSHRP